jgi:hypothetical protein
MDVLTCADRAVRDAADRINRYCGLRWSGGPAEVWAFPYFDAVASADPDVVDPVDVLCSAALHPGLGRSDLEFFVQRATKLEGWLRDAPVSVALEDADPGLVGHVVSLAALADGVGLSLLSKVVHRKRPSLVPMLDRDIVDWYRPLTGLRGAAAWPALVEALRSDLAGDANRRLLAELNADLHVGLSGPVPTPLRMVDIAIWMGRA